MKALYLAAAALLSLQSCLVINTDESGVKSNVKFTPWTSNDDKERPMKSQTYQLGPVTQIEAAAAINYTVHYSNENKVIVSSTHPDFLKVHVTRGVLTVGYKEPPHKRFNKDTQVDVYTARLTKLNASSASRIQLADKFTANSLTVVGSSAGEILGTIKADTIDIQLSSAASFEGTIEVSRVVVSASSAAKATLGGSASQVDANATSASSINLRNLRYKSISQQSNSAGSIKPGIQQ